MTTLRQFLRYHLIEAKLAKYAWEYRAWALARVVGAGLVGRERSRSFLFWRDTIIKNSRGLYYVPRGSDMILTISPMFEADFGRILEGRRGSVFLDIGANAGRYSVFLGKMGNFKVIHAFEPSTINFDVLERNIALNELESVVRCHKVALSEVNGASAFWNDRIASGHSRLVSQSNEVVPERVNVETVRTARLDSFAEDEGVRPEDIALIKIDVEGAEVAVLQGGRRILAGTRPGTMALIETSETTASEASNILTECGFTGRRMDKQYFLFVRN